MQKPQRTKDRKLLDSFKNLRCIICGAHGAVGHHIQTKGASGPDEPWNLMPLCGLDHNRVHAMGLTSFTEKYLQARLWLESNGWQYDQFRKKWQHND